MEEPCIDSVRTSLCDTVKISQVAEVYTFFMMISPFFKYQDPLVVLMSSVKVPVVPT